MTLFAPVTVYGQPGCRYCRVVTKLLQDEGVKYEYVDITTNPEAKSYVVDVLGAKQVPVVVDDFHGAIIGDQPDEWAKLIEYHSSSETGL